MNPNLEHHGLLEDVLAETGPDCERGALNGMLRAARRRRRTRRFARGCAAAGALALMVSLVWNARWPFNSANSVRPTLNIVSSQPLPPAMIVRTSSGHIAVVSSSAMTFTVVETGSVENLFQEINDDELLALAKGRSVALVRNGPQQAE